MDVLNLDKIISEKKEVILNGKKYTIPSKLPVGIFFRMMKNSKNLQDDASDPANLEDSFNILYDLLKINNKDITLEEVFLMNMDQYIELSKYIFNKGEEAEKKQIGDQSVDI
jgi:hypothetical protein